MSWLYVYIYSFFFDFDSVTQMVKNLPVVQKTHQSLGQEDHLEKGMVWRIPWTEKPHGLQSMGSQRVGYDWLTNTHTSHLGHRRALSSLCYIYTRFSLVIYFMHSNVYMSIPISQFIPPPISPFGVHVFSLCLYFCFANRFIHIISSRFHILCINIPFLFFSFWLTSLCDSVLVHPCLCKWHNLSLSWLSNIPLYMRTIVHLP